MKEIYILRHADKDSTGNLTEAGKIVASELSKHLGYFDLVYSSVKPRAVETAILLTQRRPITDMRASAISLSAEETRMTHEQGKFHDFGIAGVLFDSKIYRPKIIERGKELIQLIEELLSRLSNNERALIISHDGIMVAANMILLNIELTKAKREFEPLSGFRVLENMLIEDIQ